MSIDTASHNFKPQGIIYNPTDLKGLNIWEEAPNTGVDAEGRNYKVYTRDFIHKEFSWKFVKGIQAFLLTIFSLGFALISKDVQNLWKQSINGKEKRSIKVLISQNNTIAKVEKAIIDSKPIESAKNTKSLSESQKPVVQPTKEIEAENTIAPPSPLEQSKSDFFKWWTGENKLGKGEYEQKINPAKELSKGLPQIEMKLYSCKPRWGFSFFYGKIQDRLIPIEYNDGMMLNWQKKKENGSWWPIKDPETSSYFSPKITIEDKYIGTGSYQTGEYIYEIIQRPKGPEFEVLKVLIPYAKQIKDAVNAVEYQKLRKLIPEYPKLPC